MEHFCRLSDTDAEYVVPVFSSTISICIKRAASASRNWMPASRAGSITCVMPIRGGCAAMCLQPIPSALLIRDLSAPQIDSRCARKRIGAGATRLLLRSTAPPVFRKTLQRRGTAYPKPVEVVAIERKVAATVRGTGVV